MSEEYSQQSKDLEEILSKNSKLAGNLVTIAIENISEYFSKSVDVDNEELGEVMIDSFMEHFKFWLKNFIKNVLKVKNATRINKFFQDIDEEMRRQVEQTKVRIKMTTFNSLIFDILIIAYSIKTIFVSIKFENLNLNF